MMPAAWWGPENGRVREMDGAELVTTYDDPWVRHHTDPDAVERAYLGDGAAWIEMTNRLPGGRGTMAVALGTPETLAPLLRDVAALGAAPARLIVPAAALDVVPASLRPHPVRDWHWMLTTAMPPEPALPVVEVGDAAEIDALLDVGQPDAHTRPGSPRVEAWLGIRDRAELVAVGALRRQADGSGNLGAVTVAPHARGRGLGLALSAGLTRRALAGPAGTATLGVYTDNAPALAVYGRLGYEVVHTFTAGPVSARDITTAVAPSR